MDIPRFYEILETTIRLVALILALALIWRRHTRTGPIMMVSLNALLILTVNLVGLFPAMGIDYEFFRKAGLDVLAGLDPYSPSRFARHPFLNPPSALPLFAAFATLSPRPGLVVWTIFNLACLAALPWLVNRGLDSNSNDQRLPGPTLLGLTVAFLVSDSALVGLYLGQLSVLTTMALVVALLARQSGRPIVAGLALAVASVKVSTMLPFLLLFSKRSDLRAWVALIVFGLALGVASGGLGVLPVQLQEVASQIEAMGRPGMTNDYSFAGTEHVNMIGFDHLIYRLGLRDRVLIRGLQGLLIVVTGCWVGWLVLSRRVAGSARVSLVALFSMVFLYHRNYDLVILVIPLVDVARRVRNAEGRSRWLLATSATAMLLALNLKRDLMVSLSKVIIAWPPWPGRLAQAVLLPYVTWLLLIAMITLVMGTARGKTLADGAIKISDQPDIKPYL